MMLRSIHLFSSLLVLCLISSCKQTTPINYLDLGFETVHQSEEFTIYQKEDEFIIRVTHPFQAASNSESYHLIPHKKEFNDIEGIVHQIHYPISRISISSTTHLGYLEALGMQDRIIGASNLGLFYSEAFNAKIESGGIADIGGTKFNKEVLIKLSSDVVFAFALNPDNLNAINDLRESGIKMVLVSEFLESDPIKKAEWLKFFATFFGENKLRKSESLLETIEVQYNEIKAAVAKTDERPTVMMGFPWKGTWYVSGANSFQAKFFKDGGADYIWSEFDQSGSVPLDIEVVLKRGSMADYWLNPGNKLSIGELLEDHQNFASFESVKNLSVYSNYGRSNDYGANDSWERGVVRPDLILKDLASIFHPEIMGNRDLYFYKRLE